MNESILRQTLFNMNVSELLKQILTWQKKMFFMHLCCGYFKDNIMILVDSVHTCESNALPIWPYKICFM